MIVKLINGTVLSYVNVTPYKELETCNIYQVYLTCTAGLALK